MRKTIVMALTVIVILSLSILGIVLGNNNLTELQLRTLKILAIICGSSIAYCFIVGELARNNSQMDKLWSLLPIAYTWVIAGMGGFKPRLVVIAVIATLWGIRLTFNFARKGAYSIKFWEGEEDYRWSILRQNKIFQNKFVWGLFDLFFFSIYQNVLILAFTLPALAVMESTAAFGVFDYIAGILAFLFFCLELWSDAIQWRFHQKKKALLTGGKTLEEIEYPYSLGFNTLNIWGFMRHPNYLGEQGIWMSLYIFVIGAGVATYGIFNWSIVGPLFLILLFMGSSNLGEQISSSKYPMYKEYQRQVFKYLPLRRYKDPNHGEN